MKKTLILVMMFPLVWGLTDDVYAGGVAAQRNRGVRVDRRIRAVAPPEPSPDYPGTESSPPEADPLEDQATPSTPAPVAVQPKEVLVSSPYEFKKAPPQNREDQEQQAFTMEQSLAQLIQRLDQSSLIWINVEDMRYKVIVINYYIDRFRQQGIIIRKPAMVYTQLITRMLAGNPEMLQKPFADILSLCAVMEYDYDTGVNKDALARKMLGEQLYRSNRKRLGLE